MTSLPKSFEAAASNFAFEGLDNLGHAFEPNRGAGERGGFIFCRKEHRLRGRRCIGVMLVQGRNRARLASVCPISPSASASSAANCAGIVP